jgi:hypothetical protein
MRTGLEREGGEGGGGRRQSGGSVRCHDDNHYPVGFGLVTVWF